MNGGPTEEMNASTDLLASRRLLTLQQLSNTAIRVAATHLPNLVSRISASLAKASTDTRQASESARYVRIMRHFRQYEQRFAQIATIRISDLLLHQLHRLQDSHRHQDIEAEQMSLVSFDEMENQVMIDTLAEEVERTHADSYALLEARLADLMGYEILPAQSNPFRPDMFVQAVYEAWIRIEDDSETGALFLKLLTPDTFAYLEHVVAALNQDLIAQGILPDLKKAYRNRRSNIGSPDAAFEAKTATPAATPAANLSADARARLAAVANRLKNVENAPPVRSKALEFLTRAQKSTVNWVSADLDQVRRDSFSRLRKIVADAPPGSLQVADQDTIEILALVFDYLFADTRMPPVVRQLLAQLQIPLLKAALLDRDIFRTRGHAAWRLVDAMAAGASVLDEQQGEADPLFQMMLRTVERVQQEFENSSDLLATVGSELEEFLELEQAGAVRDLTELKAEAVRQERMERSQVLAARDVASRIETGEVAGFVEQFLEKQWVKILAMAHNVSDVKPEALEQVRKVMDDLIWSVKPKHDKDERKALISRLPSMLFLLNGWLNAIKWDEGERQSFFSTLADRHAAIVRLPLELSARQQLEMAVTIAQKASEHMLNQRERELATRPMDEMMMAVHELELEQWVEFKRANGSAVKLRLAWISPLRTRFIFVGRQGYEPFRLTAEQLAQGLRAHRVNVVDRRPVMADTLSTVLGKPN